MKNLILLSFLFVSYLSFAQDNNTLLWKIEGKNLNKPSYLYGTMHVQDKRAFEFRDSVMAKLNEADAMAVEVVTDDNSFSMLQHILLDSSQSLEDFASPEEIETIKAYVEETIPMLAPMVNQMKPFFLYSTISVMRMKTDMPYFVDQYLQKNAEEAGKKVVGLETIEEQILAAEAVPGEAYISLLLDIINNPEKNDSLGEIMVQMYNEERVEDLHNFLKNYELPQQFYESLLDKRNSIMVQRIDSLIRNESFFIAVGAGHLLGESGLVPLLRKQGYKVSPIFSEYSATKSAQLYPDDHTWHKFLSEKRVFEIEMPIEPEERIQQVETEAGEVTQYMYGGEDKSKGVFFMAGYFDLTEDMQKEEGDYFENSIERMKKKYSKMVKHEKIIQQGIEGMDTEFQVAPGMNLRTRILKSDNRVYMILMGGSSDYINSDTAERYINSFKIIE